MIILEVLKGIFIISIVFGGIFVILIVLWSIIVILEDLKVFGYIVCLKCISIILEVLSML